MTSADEKKPECGESIGADFSGGDVAEEQYYRSPEGHFWWLNQRGDWIGRPQSDFKLKLKSVGCCTTVQNGKKMSELEQQFLLVSAENGVDYAGLIAGWKPGYYERDGTRYLISREIPPMAPSGADFESLKRQCPNLLRLLNGIFKGVDSDADIRTNQLLTFLGWWHHAYTCLRNNDTRNGLALVLAGDVGCGKTLLKEFIRYSFGGREAQPYRWFTGQEQFNGNLMQSPLWTVDDEQADTSFKARNHFGAKLKLCVANAGVPFRAMHRDELTLYPFRRIIICVNREPERLMVLPPLASDVEDKMLILKCYNNKICADLRRKPEAEKAAFFQSSIKELPHFLEWLSNHWKIPAGMSGRFGVPHWCHPEIERELFTLSPMQRTWELVRKYVQATLPGTSKKWVGGAQMLWSGMTGNEDALSRKERDLVPNSPGWLGKQLTTLMKNYPDAISFARRSGSNEWTIDISNYMGAEND